jgi:hypothetical protein
MPDRRMNREPWVIDQESVREMASLQPGEAVTVVKRDAAGEDVTTYPGGVVDTTAESPWVEIEAIWTVPDLEPEGGLAFVPGDIMREFFSPAHPFNAFAVFSPEGELRGWYGNVTHPATVEREGDGTRLVWRDLYLDVVLLPNGAMTLLDEDDLRDSRLTHTNPVLASAIVAARAHLILAIPHFPQTIDRPSR